MDWDNHNPSSRYTPPPPAQSPDGQWIIYTGTLPAKLNDPARFGATPEGYRSYEFGPVTIALAGGKNYEIKYFTQSVKKFVNRKTQEAMNVSGVSKVLKAAGFAGKPQQNKEYDAAVGAIGGRKIQFTIDWRARNKDNGEEVKGYENFPLDPDRPGFRKAILKAGDLLPNGEMVKSEVLFANAQVRFVESK
jgi:hypothetical protein